MWDDLADAHGTIYISTFTFPFYFYYLYFILFFSMEVFGSWILVLLVLAQMALCTVSYSSVIMMWIVQGYGITIIDFVLRKRVLTYWKILGK